MFENIKSLRPHFHSLREIEGNVSLDIKLPLNWKFEDIIKPYRSIKVKLQDKNEKYTLLSLVTNATQEGYDVIFACALEVLTQNKEEEEKTMSNTKYTHAQTPPKCTYTTYTTKTIIDLCISQSIRTGSCDRPTVSASSSLRHK